MIIKVNRTSAYTVMSNYHLRDKRLSLKAKGLLSLMLSLPSDWDYSVAGLVALSTEGQTAIESALKELQDNGYVFVVKLFPDQTKNGRIDYEYNIYEKPVTMPQNDEPPKADKTTPKKKKNGDLTALVAKYTEITDEKMKIIKEWLEIRKGKRLGVTESGIEYNLKKLAQYSKQAGVTETEYLEEVVARGWGAFYPLNNHKVPEQKMGTIPSYNIDQIENDIMKDDIVYKKKKNKT